MIRSVVLTVSVLQSAKHWTKDNSIYVSSTCLEISVEDWPFERHELSLNIVMFYN